MKRTRFSLFYLVGYLIPSGLLLLIAPHFALTLLFSNGAYGDVLPRLVGGLLIGLGILVVQIIRFRLEMLYTTIIWVRAFFCLCFVVFYFIGHDPFFLVLLAVVGFGLILTTASYLRDRQSASIN